MINQRQSRDRTGGAEGGRGKRLIDARSLARSFVRSIYHSIPRVSLNVQRRRLRFPKSGVYTLLSYPGERARTKKKIGAREYVTTGTVHTIKCKRKKKNGGLAGWLADCSTILVWMTANDFPPRFLAADSRGLWPKCRLTRAHQAAKCIDSLSPRV